nr:Unknown Function [uncultured bacterium]
MEIGTGRWLRVLTASFASVSAASHSDFFRHTRRGIIEPTNCSVLQTILSPSFFFVASFDSAQADPEMRTDTAPSVSKRRMDVSPENLSVADDLRETAEQQALIGERQREAGGLVTNVL